MEAGATGAGQSTPTDQQASLNQALSDLETALGQMTTRVNTDLDALKAEVKQANEHPDIDLSSVITRIEAIQETVINIDVAQVVTQIPAPDAAAPAASGEGDPATQGPTPIMPDPATAEAGAVTGDQGQPATDAPAPDAPADPATATPGADPAPVSPADPAAQQRTVYTFDGDASQIDTASWPRAPFNTEDGRALYFFVSDTEPGQASGQGFEGWSVYTGATVSA